MSTEDQNDQPLDAIPDQPGVDPATTTDETDAAAALAQDDLTREAALGGDTDPAAEASQSPPPLARATGTAVGEYVEPKPSMGRIVHYRVTEEQAEAINRSREDGKRCMERHRKAKTGTMVHVGNPVEPGDEFPMTIVRVWGTEPSCPVNGQVTLDGTDTLWVTSAHQGDQPGEWRWPPRV